ncbi:TIGR02391 family protein [Micromonospora sp. MED01]|uniref:TIGR02391 family protein n=1 Tax=Micromonospora alfalfae TaxID=2911212 RepID=UPI001EE91026|nr:TIGR02391 family protein [Micromonospora alfalfae]MCG5462886.1 TIGR02391 family protein [Micromonospora alfalfae]
MNESLARERLAGVLQLIDQWGDLYDRRWGKREPYGEENPALDSQVDSLIDEVRSRTRLARDVIVAMGEVQLAAKVVEHEEGVYGGHPFTQARVAIVEAISSLAQREELAEIIGPVGPRLSASELHPTIWGAAAKLWDDGHLRAAVQTGATALEGLLQGIAGPGVSGEGLAGLFSIGDPTVASPRLRLRDVDSASKTWKSAHEGAAAMIRGAFMGVRNVVSHPGWPDPSSREALEMLAVLSYVAHLVDRSDKADAQ